MTTPGIPNRYSLSTTCFGTRLPAIQDQIFAAVGMGFRRIELGLTSVPADMEGLQDSQRETGVTIPSMMVGCRDPLNGSMATEHLGSLVGEESERAMNVVRRHARLARAWGCPVIVVRGTRVQDKRLRAKAEELERRFQLLGAKEDPAAVREAHRELIRCVEKTAQKQVEQLCRALYTLASEEPELTFALEPGRRMDDLLTFQTMGWILDDLSSSNVGYWHDVGHVHVRERRGLPGQGAWLDAYGGRLLGVHLQDVVGDELELPLGLGEVDFRLLQEYLPDKAERVIEIGPSHGRAEILASVRFLVEKGF